VNGAFDMIRRSTSHLTCLSHTRATSSYLARDCCFFPSLPIFSSLPYSVRPASLRYSCSPKHSRYHRATRSVHTLHPSSRRLAKAAPPQMSITPALLPSHYTSLRGRLLHRPRGSILGGRDPNQIFLGAIDQGTTSTRFTVFDTNGVPVAQHQLEFKQMYPNPG
jgi:hypothetical protein